MEKQVFFYKIKHLVIIHPTNHILWHLSKKDLCSFKNLYMNIHSSITDSTQTGSKAHIPQQTNAELWHIHTMEYPLSNKTERTAHTDTHEDLKRS